MMTDPPLHERLAQLAERWQELATLSTPAPYLDTNPRIAYGQALNQCAEELTDLLLEEFDD